MTRYVVRARGRRGIAAQVETSDHTDAERIRAGLAAANRQWAVSITPIEIAERVADLDARRAA